jgi:hypothetical protein
MQPLSAGVPERLHGVLALPEARYLYPAQVGVLVARSLFAEGPVNLVRLYCQGNHPTAPDGRRS